LIPVTPKAEPRGFDVAVRNPGKKFLLNNPNPSSRQYDKHKYWQEASEDLRAAYRGVCAYTCMYIFGPGTVDHFLPKVKYPEHAYEWNNYRLASFRANYHKNDSTEVIDPFVVQPGWFVLDIPSCLVRPGDHLSKIVFDQVNETIKTLKLNDDDFFVQERCDIMVEYANGEVNLGFLSRRYPFLAAEIVRQNIQDTAHLYFKRR